MSGISIGCSDAAWGNELGELLMRQDRYLSGAILGLMIAMLIGVAHGVASASLVQYTGTFSASNFDNASVTPNTISGTWVSAPFDTSLVNPAASTETFEIDLDQLTLTPSTIGTTVFDTSNTKLWLNYASGDLITAVIGGAPNGPAGGGGNDDFGMAYFASTGLLLGSVSVNNASPALNAFSGTQSGSFSVIPEPTSLVLMMCGAAMLMRRRRR